MYEHTPDKEIGIMTCSFPLLLNEIKDGLKGATDIKIKPTKGIETFLFLTKTDESTSIPIQRATGKREEEFYDGKSYIILVDPNPHQYKLLERITQHLFDNKGIIPKLTSIYRLTPQEIELILKQYQD